MNTFMTLNFKLSTKKNGRTKAQAIWTLLLLMLGNLGSHHTNHLKVYITNTTKQRILLLLGTLLNVCVGSAQPMDSTEQDKSSPFTFGTTIQGGMFSNFSGGIDQGLDYIGRVHFTIGMSTEKAGLWKNGEIFFNGVNTHGGNPTAKYIGDFQPISRNEAAPERTGLFELWYKHSFKNFFVLIGQHDMNSSIGTSTYAGNSINSAFGMNPSITPNAGYSFSIFPRTMPAVYVKYDHFKLGNASISFQGAVYAGTSQDFDKDRYNVKWKLDGTTHSRLEVHYLKKRSVVKLGAMYHSGQFPSVIDDQSTVSGNLGFYLMTDQLILPEDEQSEQGLGFFLQLGVASGDQNLVPLFFSAGVNYKGILEGHDNDNLFVGLVFSSLNDQVVENAGMDNSRSVIELNYALAIGQYLVVQPDLQYIINPGANPQLKNTFSGLLRFSINY